MNRQVSRKHWKNCALAIFVAATSLTGQSLGFTAIDFPGATATLAWGINNRGDVAGLYMLADKSVHGFVSKAGNLTSIDFPGATKTDVFGINQAGDLVGDYTINGKTHGFVLSQGRFTTVDVPGAASTSLAAINSSGNIVGAYTLADGSTHSILIHDGQFTNIDIPNQTTTLGNGINEDGDIVGNQINGGITHGFVLSKGKLTTISVPNANFTGTYGIDSAGNVVGRYQDASGAFHGYVYSGGAFTTIDIPGATLTSAAAMNSVGDIAGRYVSGGVNHAFVVSSPALHYKVTDLGTLTGGSFSQATFVANSGLVAGLADVANGSQHAVLWQFGGILDITTPGMNAVNSGVFGINAAGVADGVVESAVPDPNGEDFCGYGTHRQCKAFVWENGAMTVLPTLGGNNGSVGNINKHGVVSGFTETSLVDSTCLSSHVQRYEAVLWGPKQGQVRELMPLPGDTVGAALWVNDNGEAVGVSGLCSNTVLPPLAYGPHAVKWEKDGSVVDLGNLGGSVDPATLGLGTIALAINNPGVAVGASALSGNKTTHAFRWTEQKGIQDLGTLSGDVGSAALAINDRGEIVGGSYGAAGPVEGNPRAFLWRNGIMTDLNTLVPSNSPLHLIIPFGINSEGEIVGFGVTPEGDIHAFLATPVEGPADSALAVQSLTSPLLLDHAKKVLQDRLGRMGAPLQ